MPGINKTNSSIRITNDLEGGEASSGAVNQDESLGDGTLLEVGSWSF